MGMDIYSRLVAGVSAKTLYCEKDEMVSVTQYHRDTGEPYQDEQRKTTQWLANEPITCGQLQSLLDHKVNWNGLHGFCFNNYDNLDVLGLEIAITPSHRSGGMSISVSQEKITEIMDKVKAIVQKIDPNLKVELLLMTYLNY